ncbi:hypothetical protein GCM10027168_32920 [Streptomyces capparidis]
MSKGFPIREEVVTFADERWKRAPGGTRPDPPALPDSTPAAPPSEPPPRVAAALGASARACASD